MTTPSPLVLLVEDDHGVRRPLEKFLQMHDFTVVTAETADDAIDAIHQHRPVAAIAFYDRGTEGRDGGAFPPGTSGTPTWIRWSRSPADIA